MGAKRFFGLWGISVVVAWFGHEAKTEAKKKRRVSRDKDVAAANSVRKHCSTIYATYLVHDILIYLLFADF